MPQAMPLQAVAHDTCHALGTSYRFSRDHGCTSGGGHRESGFEWRGACGLDCTGRILGGGDARALGSPRIPWAPLDARCRDWTIDRGV